MQKVILLMAIVSGLLLPGVTEQVHGQKRVKKEQKEQEIKQLIESGKFRFVARSAIPLSGPKIELTSLYDLKIDSTMVESWLPFFGVAYRAEYGDRDGGIKFKQEADNISVVFNAKKKIYNISIDANTQKDNYQIRITAGLSGYADASVNSMNRQSINFYGTIQPLE